MGRRDRRLFNLIAMIRSLIAMVRSLIAVVRSLITMIGIRGLKLFWFLVLLS